MRCSLLADQLAKGGSAAAGGARRRRRGGAAGEEGEDGDGADGAGSAAASAAEVRIVRSLLSQLSGVSASEAAAVGRFVASLTPRQCPASMQGAVKALFGSPEMASTLSEMGEEERGAMLSALAQSANVNLCDSESSAQSLNEGLE